MRGSNTGGGEIFRTCPDRLRGTPNLLYNGYRVFTGGKGGRGVVLTTYSLLSAEVYKKGRAIPLLFLRACAAYNRAKSYNYVVVRGGTVG